MTEIFFSIAPSADKLIIAILAVFSVLTMGISLERYFFLRPLYRKSVWVRRELKILLESGDFGKLQDLAQDASTPGGRALSLALKHIKKYGTAGLPELFNSVYLQEKPRLEGAISVLAAIGANAPFVGLLGTVFGIMRSFYDLGIATNTAGAPAVMAGISTALLATAMGLTVAIPAVMLYNFFRRRVTAVLDTVEHIRETCLTYSRSQIKQ